MGQEFGSPAGCASPAVARYNTTQGGFQQRLTRNVNIDRNVKEFSRFWGTGIVARPNRTKAKRKRFTKQCSTNSYTSRRSSRLNAGSGLTSDDEELGAGSSGWQSGSHTPSHKHSSSSVSPRAHSMSPMPRPPSRSRCNSLYPTDVPRRGSYEAAGSTGSLLQQHQPQAMAASSSLFAAVAPPPPSHSEYLAANPSVNGSPQRQEDYPLTVHNKQLWMQQAVPCGASANNLLCPSPPDVLASRLRHNSPAGAAGRMYPNARLVKQRSLSPSPSYRMPTPADDEADYLYGDTTAAYACLSGQLGGRASPQQQCIRPSGRPSYMDTPPTSCRSSYGRLPAPSDPPPLSGRSPHSLQPAPSPPNAFSQRARASQLRHQMSVQQHMDSSTSTSPRLLSMGNSFDIDGDFVPDSYSPRQRMYSNASNASATLAAPLPYHINQLPCYDALAPPPPPPPPSSGLGGHRRHVFATKGRYLTVDVHTAD